jgi:pimeloyl-ACP methyl ester carboxylesterase
MKLSLVPVALAVAVAGLVYVGTHPPSVPLPGDPATVGLFYDSVTIASSDGKRIEGWLVQPLDARRVLVEKESALKAKYPAVVLVHDYAASKQQMLPLMAPLREAGFVVLAISLRGCGTSDAAAQTFGLRERDDVRAAVRLLENQTFVDKARIAVVGSGTGANAALLAAADDQAIRAVVLDAPITDADTAIHRYVVPEHPYLKFLTPLCRWSIEMSWGVSFAQLDMARQVDKVAPRPVLILQGGDGSGYPGGAVGRQVIAFLHLHLKPPVLKTSPRQKTIVSATR